MKISLVILVFSFMIIGCANTTKPVIVKQASIIEGTHILTNDLNKNIESEIVTQEKPKQLIGGWAPVFFSDFNTQELNKIVYGMKNKKIKKAVISYPKTMNELALKIQTYLQNKTRQKIAKQLVELQNTAQVQYNITQVIVTLYFYDEK